MKIYKTRYAALALVASMSVLAACSNEDDTAPTVSDSSSTMESSPMTTPPTPTQPPAESAPPAQTGSVMTDTDAKSTQDAVAEKAAEIRDDAVEAANRAGEAIKEGAREANEAIQDTLSKGTPPENSPEAEQQAGQ